MTTCLLSWGLANVLPRLASNFDHPDLCLLRSWDYRYDHHTLEGYFLSLALSAYSLLPACCGTGSFIPLRAPTMVFCLTMAKYLWTETSETMIQEKSFLF
jgi:hypothetical protein